MMDKMRVQQILLNLLSNAIKFSPNYGTIKITVNTEVNENQTLNVLISVQDSGIGINP